MTGRIGRFTRRRRRAAVAFAVVVALLAAGVPAALAQADPPAECPEPTDALAGHQWALAKIDAYCAWLDATGAGIKVALIGDGVYFTNKNPDAPVAHPDLDCIPGKLAFTTTRTGPRYEASNIGAADSLPFDNNGHSTHAAGIIGACTGIGDNSSDTEGIAGVAPDSILLPYKASGSDTFAAAVERAMRAGAHVIVVAKSEGTTSVEGFRSALEDAAAQGTVVVVPAEDRAGRTCAFGDVRGAVCVGATDKDDRLASYSASPYKGINESTGAPAAEAGYAVLAPGGVVPVGAPVRDGPECTAYGEAVVSLWAKKFLCGGDHYALDDGTVQAAAHVAGIAALAYEKLGRIRHPDNARAIIEALLAGAYDPRPLSDELLHGAGIAHATSTLANLPDEAPADAAADLPREPDPLSRHQWALDRIRAAGAWQRGATGDGVTIAVIGGGVDAEHEDLSCLDDTKVTQHFMVGGSTPTRPAPLSFDTYAAGIAAACADTPRGIKGVAPHARVLAIRISQTQRPDLKEWEKVPDAVRYAASAGAQVIQLPLLPRDLRDRVDDQAERPGNQRRRLGAAVEEVVRTGVTVVAPAGDDAAPACQYALYGEGSQIPQILCAVGTDRHDVKFVRSAVGANNGGHVLSAPSGGGVSNNDCYSPDQGVLSLWQEDSADCSGDAWGYATKATTVAAAAHLAGVAALGYDIFDDFPPPATPEGERENAGEIILNAMKDSADPIAPDQVYGYGMVDAAGTVEKLLEVLDRAETEDPLPDDRISPEDPDDSPVVANDPLYSEKPDENKQWALAKINAPEVWSQTSGSGVAVAVIHSGVDPHNDLVDADFCPNKLRVVPGADVTDPTSAPNDVSGRGTHIAGIIGACTGNGKGMAGVAPRAEIMPFQVQSDAGDIELGDVASAVRKATDHGARVIYLGVRTGAPILDVPELNRAIGRALDRGVVVVAPAGGAGWYACEPPANVPGVICVGSTDPDDRRTAQSSSANKGDSVALVAPGGTAGSSVFCDLYEHNIVSTFPERFNDCPDQLSRGALEDGYRTLNGADLAAAHVAGAAALLYAELDERKIANVLRVSDALIDSAVDLGPEGHDAVFGAGLLDVQRALAELGRRGRRSRSPSDVTPDWAPYYDASRPGVNVRMSTTSSEAEARSYSQTPSISADGRYVAFTSDASNLTGGDESGFPQVYVKDRLTGEVELVSGRRLHTGEVVPGNACSSEPSISPDGRFVAFTSGADNLVENDTNGDVFFVCAFTDVFVHDRYTGQIVRVSVTSGGGEATKMGGEIPKSWGPVISGVIAQGGTEFLRVLFFSNADNLTPPLGADTKWGSLYVHDVALSDSVSAFQMTNGATRMVDVTPNGAAYDGDQPFGYDMTTDGRFVSFTASGFLGGDDDYTGVYVRDLEETNLEKATTEVSVNSAGEEANGRSEHSAISDDGRYVAFGSLATNLVPEDAAYIPLHNSSQVYVHDRQTGLTERVSVTSAGAETFDHYRTPAISADGRHVAFVVDRMGYFGEPYHDDAATNRNTYPIRTILLHDRRTGTTELVPVDDEGAEGNDHSSYIGEHPVPILSNGLGRDAPSLSGDGRYVAFHSFASNLVEDDDNLTIDVFLRDRGPVNGVADAVVESGSDDVRVSGWATFSGATIGDSAAEPRIEPPLADVVKELGGQLTHAEVIYRPEHRDLLVRWRLAELPSVEVPREALKNPLSGRDWFIPVDRSTAPAPIVYGLRFKARPPGHADGVAYELRGTRVATERSHKLRDASFVLYRCDLACNTPVARLDGGVGTAGVEARSAIPLRTIEWRRNEPLREGDVLQGAVAFTALGDVRTGTVRDAYIADLGSRQVPARSVEISAVRRDHPAAFGPPQLLTGSSFTTNIAAPDAATTDWDLAARGCLGRQCQDPPFERLHPDQIEPFAKINPPPPLEDALPPPPSDGVDDVAPTPVTQQPPIAALQGEPGTTTILTGGSHGDGLDARSAPLSDPSGLAVGPGGLYITDSAHQQIRVVRPGNTISTLAGSRVGFEDGAPRSARFRYPEGLDVDQQGNVYVADRYNDRIRKIVVDPATGDAMEVTTLAGDGEEGYAGDGGRAVDASLHEPRDVALFHEPGGGTYLYIADYENHVVRVVKPDGSIDTFAGTGTPGVPVSGVPATASPIWGPSSVAVDAAGNVYIADERNCVIRKVGSDGIIRTVAGSDAAPDTSGGREEGDELQCISHHYELDEDTKTPATDAYLAFPQGVEVDPDGGRLFITEDPGGGRIQMVNEDGYIQTIAGDGEAGCPAEPTSATSGISGPHAIALGPAVDPAMSSDPPDVYFTATGRFGAMGGCGRVFRLSGENLADLEPIAGSGGSVRAQPDMPASAATFGNGITAVAYGPDGQPYFTSEATRIWTIRPDGTLDIVAGGKEMRFPRSGEADGPAMDARFGYISALQFDGFGRLWIVDRWAEKIKVLDGGRVKTVAGSGKRSGQEAEVAREGEALQVRLDRPMDLAVAPDGSVYFTEQVREGRVRVFRDGNVYTVAGDVDKSGDCLDDGDCVDSKYYDGDGENINHSDPETGLPAKVEFQFPEGIDVGADGSIYVADSWNHRVRRIAPDGTISTVAGDGGMSHGTKPPRQDGLAVQRSIPYPNAVAADNNGNLFIGDAFDFTFEPSDSSILQVSPRGMLTRVAGNGNDEPGPGGASLASSLWRPASIAVTPNGLLVADASTVRFVTPPTGGWPDPEPALRCDPFGYSDPEGDVVYNVLSLPTRVAKDWIDVLGGDVETTPETITATIDVKDLDHSLGRAPAGDEFGKEYLWMYLFQDPDIQDSSQTMGTDGRAPIFAYYVAARTPSLDVAPTFEYGVADMINSGNWKLTKFGTATGSFDPAANRVTLTAPVSGFAQVPEGFDPKVELSLVEGEIVVHQEFTAGAINVADGARTLDVAPTTRSRVVRRGGDPEGGTYYQGTTRSYRIGTNCTEFGPTREEPAPPVDESPTGPPHPSPPPPSGDSPAAKPVREFVARGVIRASNPSAVAAPSVTELDFLSSCRIPTTQGLDGYVFEVPPDYVDPDARAHVTGKSAIGIYNLDAYFYSSDCDSLDAAAGPPSDHVDLEVPEATRYVVANAVLGIQTEVTLRIVAPVRESAPEPTPVATPSPTASPTPSLPAAQGVASTTLTASRRSAHFGDRLRLVGRVQREEPCSGPLTITILRRVHGTDSFKEIADPVAAKRGRWSTQLRVTRSAAYIAQVGDSETCRGEVSAPADVQVRVRIKLDVPKRCVRRSVVRGVVRPAQPATRVHLHRRRNGKWERVGTAGVSKRSRFSVGLRHCSGHYRVVWPQQNPSNLRGVKNFRLR